jgi:ketosteroid isomerase-like protein
MDMNEQLISDFYSAFQARDGAKMSAFYDAEAVFSDAAFGTLHGKEIGAMWWMLCLRGKDLRIEFRDVKADATRGSVHWEAWYTFSSTGRKVHNVIDASFVFKDGRIIEHHDHFNFWRWASQALGLTGLLLGWTPFIQSKVRAQAKSGLTLFIQKESQ